MVMPGWIEVVLPLGVAAATFVFGVGVVRKPWRRPSSEHVDELAVVDAYNRALFSGLQPGEMSTFAAVAAELCTTPALVRDVIARRWRS